MKIAFGMIVLNGNYVLKEALQSVYPFATQILIAEGPVSYWQSQGVMESTDGTIATLENFPDPDNKITVVQGQYSEKDEQCNSYMRYMRDDIDYVWNLDCDEIFKPEDISTVIKLLAKENYTSVGFKSCTFYGGFNHVLGGFEEGAEFIRVQRYFRGHSGRLIDHPQWLTNTKTFRLKIILIIIRSMKNTMLECITIPMFFQIKSTTKLNTTKKQ